MQRDILDESAKGGYDGFPFGKDAIGTNLYAYTGNNPVSKVDPSGMWSLYDLGRAVGGLLGGLIGGRAGAQVGAAIGGFAGGAVDYAIGYVSGYTGGSGYSGGGYSGGGYGFAGHQAGSAARSRAKGSPPKVALLPPPPKPARTGSLDRVPGGQVAMQTGAQAVSLKNLDWGTANALYNYGRGKITPVVPASSVSGLSGIKESQFDESGRFSTNLWFNPGATNNDRLVYGGITLQNLGNGRARIEPDFYDFDQQPGIGPLTSLRNAGTAGGELTAYGSSGVFGRPYDIYFTGTISVYDG